MQKRMGEVVERYQLMVDRMRKELPRFHDETARELGDAFRTCAQLQVCNTIRSSKVDLQVIRHM